MFLAENENGTENEPSFIFGQNENENQSCQSFLPQKQKQN